MLLILRRVLSGIFWAVFRAFFHIFTGILSPDIHQIIPAVILIHL
jgi:hypothetical protein